MIVYQYHFDKDQTWITVNGRVDVYPGELDFKSVHDKYDTLVFEIIKPDPIIPFDSR